MKITLLRHGKPAVELSGSVRARELKTIAKAYEVSGIVDDPPPPVVGAVQGNRVVVCSHLPRSLESAEALGFTEIHLVDALFSETAMPHFGSGRLKLPIEGWLVLLRLLWLFGFSRNGESFRMAKKRARRAAGKLKELSAMHGQVLLVGHGLMNYLIARELTVSGWTGPSKPGRNYWDYAVYSAPVA